MRQYKAVTLEFRSPETDHIEVCITLLINKSEGHWKNISHAMIWSSIVSDWYNITREITTDITRAKSKWHEHISNAVDKYIENEENTDHTPEGMSDNE